MFHVLITHFHWFTNHIVFYSSYPCRNLPCPASVNHVPVINNISSALAAFNFVVVDPGFFNNFKLNYLLRWFLVNCSQVSH